MADQNPSISQSKIIQRNGKSVQILSYPDGLREERQLDAKGIANGDYGIYQKDKCIEYGTMKNGKRDGVSEKYDEDENIKSVTFYKDGKERKIMTALARMMITINKIVQKAEKKHNEDLLNYRVQGYAWLQSLKELFNKLTGFEKLRELFAPRRAETKNAQKEVKESNHELLKSHSSRLQKVSVPLQRAAENQSIKQEKTQARKLDTRQLAGLAGKGSRGG